MRLTGSDSISPASRFSTRKARRTLNVDQFYTDLKQALALGDELNQKRAERYCGTVYETNGALRAVQE